MMPNNYHFLMRYAHQSDNSELKKHVFHTLNQISFGGIYDHAGGGFSRYSTDKKWHVPHFEKMLYDNAQLVSLYSDAFLVTKNDWYKQVVYETLEFIARELTDKEGAFYSSLDADSLSGTGELEEGAYYVWQKAELQELLKADFELFSDYYNINSYGIWEHNKYILIRNKSDSDFITKHQIYREDFFLKQKQWKKILFENREKRERPRLDDKSLTSWNALMLKGYVDAFRVFNKASFLDVALKNANFIITNQLEDSGRLFHNYKDGKTTINGYLEDYATTIEAFIALYEVTLNEDYLELSKKMAGYVEKHFNNNISNLYYFTSDLDTSLVSRSIKFSDNVIPASNSIMAKNLYKLYHHSSNPVYLDISKKMIHDVQPSFENYPSGYSNWLDLYLNFTYPFYEVIVTGKNAQNKIQEI